jgi:MSHA pilin protein MshD
MGNSEYRQFGLTLVELVISIVIMSIVMVGMFSVIRVAVGHSADPIVEHQALAVAESYMDEILLQNYTCTGSPSSRSQYNCVDNYNGLSDSGAHDENGNAISGLSSYNVSVSVNDAASIGPGANTQTAKQITVTVIAPGIPSPGLSLVGYRTSY